MPFRQCAAECARGRAQRDADQGIQEQDPDQKSPEAAGGRSRRRGVEKLAELDRASFGFDGDNGIADRQMLLCSLNSRCRTSSAFCSDG